MDLIWNEFDLKQPPLITLKVKSPKFNISELRKIIDDAIEFYTAQNEFDETAALCSRVMARRKNSFRKMAGFKSFCKLNTALCRLLRVDIKEILRNFHGLLPDFVGSGFYVELPTQANFDYIVIRLIALHKIYIRIMQCCCDVARYFTKIMSQNFFVDIIIVILAISASLWKLSMQNANRSCKLYETLLPFRQYFPVSKKPWLKESLEFPTELKKISSTNPFTQHEEKLPSTKEVLKFLKVENTSQNQRVKLGNVQKMESSSSTAEDVGIEISRDSLKPAFNLNEFNTVEKIRLFLQKEEEQRRASLRNCVTKNVQNEKWIILKKRIKNKINSNDNRAAVKEFKTAFKDII